MAVRIAFWGPSGTGKTTLAVKLSDRISQKHSVAVVFCDRTNPPLPYLFPKHRDGDIKSIGTALSSIEISEEKVMSSATVAENGNVIYLGYSGGENLYSYPSCSYGRAAALINALDPIVDYIIFDCPSVFINDALTEAAMKNADCVFRLYTPALSSFTFYESQLAVLTGEDYKLDLHHKVLVFPDTEIPLAESEAKTFMGKCEFSIPHAKILKRQLAEGCLPGTKVNRAFNKTIDKIAAMITSEK